MGGRKFNGAGVILTESALDDILAESVKLKPNVTMNKTIYGQDFDVKTVLSTVGGKVLQTNICVIPSKKTAHTAVFGGQKEID